MNHSIEQGVKKICEGKKVRRPSHGRKNFSEHKFWQVADV